MASEAETHDEEDSVPNRQLDDRMPCLLPEELLCVRRAIEQTCLPSWVDRLPLELGAASAGSLKAAEWGILYTVFYPLVLMPLWDLCDVNIDRKILSANLVQLVHIIHKLNHRKITIVDVSSLREAIQQYRKHTLANWPSVNSKPNIHILQHFPDVIDRFGPPAAFAAWAQERLNGLLGKAKTNNHPGALSKTLFRRWIQRATLKRLGGLTDRNVDEGIQGSKTMIDSTPIQGEIYDRWLDHLNTYPPYSSSKWVRNAAGVDRSDSTTLKPTVMLQPSFKDTQKKNYTVERGHPETRTSTLPWEAKTYLEVYKPSLLRNRFPTPHLHNLHYQLLARPKTPQTLVICIKNVIGHVAVLSNVPGVFGIDTETVSVAIVHHLGVTRD
ncbi:hypothetical protein PSTT_15601 [Puccinia striiformis]|uniref:Uncharacterized protein n=1 Tax=Puccinia striiformis TaxID=27350 RepID=A0A2S4UH31_9BASI|nr:hypothetical protein PSTT_15601 [Puccinia striiformis]